MFRNVLIPVLALLIVVSLPGWVPSTQLWAQREYGFDNRKSSGQPYLKPEETVARFQVAEEFEVRLFAGEPMVTNPVAFTIDEKGRVWVVECFEYPKRTPPGKQPRDRIVILEDTNGDGVCDKRTVFAEGKDFPIPEERRKAQLGAFDLCTGIEVGHGGVFVGAAPYLWFIENNNDQPGKFEILLKGFGSQDTHETLNTFQWGPDGWLYGLHGIFTNSAVRPADSLDGPAVRMNAAVWRYHPKLKKFEVFAEGTSNPWGMDWRNTDGQFILCCCVIPHLYHIVPGGIYKRQAGASFNPYVYGYLNEICDHTFHKESGWAHAGLISLDVPHIPARFRNSVIFGSIHGCSIKQNILQPHGSTFTARRGDDFLVSGDKNFRPINMKWGPNGDIFLIDWHDQYPCHQTPPDAWDYDHGRVYRIQLKGTTTKKADDLSRLTTAQLGERAIHSTNPWERRTALRLLAERTDNLRVPHIPRERTLEMLILARYRDGQLDEDAARFYLRMFDLYPQNAVQRAFIARTLGDVGGPCPSLVAGLNQLATSETEPAVRREIASAALRLSSANEVAPLLRSLLGHQADARDPVIPQLVWQGYEKLLTDERKAPHKAQELAWLAKQAPSNSFVREQIVPRTMRRLAATGLASDLALCIDFIAKTQDPATREKALEGLATALDKQTVVPPDQWAALYAEILKDNQPKPVALANKLAVSFREASAIQRALATAQQAGLTPEVRAEAIRQIALLKPAEGVKVLLGLLRSEGPAPVRAEAARALAAFDDNTIPGQLLAGWKNYPAAVRPDVVNTLASRKDWVKALLQALLDKTIDRGDVTDNTILRIQAFNDKELNALIEKAWGRTRTTPAELQKLIDKTRESLSDAPASFTRGRKVFETNCAKCHKFEGQGAEVGPALDGAGRDIEYILINVLDPNRVIGAPYFVRTARLLDDTVVQGILAEEDEHTITLKLENNVLKKIKKEDLAEPVRVAEKSLMPEGLGYNMTAQDFRDLVRYLMAHPFVTDVRINGEPAAFGVPGRMVFPDSGGEPIVVEAEFTAASALTTKLLIGSSANYEVRIDGQAIGTGTGAGKDLRPDRDSFDVAITPGRHRLTIVLKGGGSHALYARFLDPERQLSYPEFSAGQ